MLKTALKEIEKTGCKMHKVMGLDVGTKRIGIALSDFLLLTAQPCETISREPEKKRFKNCTRFVSKTM